MSNKLTRDGVAHDLKISPYKHKIDYKNHVIEYVFSSNNVKNIFLRKLEDNRTKINESLTNRFGFNIVNDLLCDMKLYSSTEKRGFLIYVNEKALECLNIIELDGETLIYKS